ncbi:MAG: hypothetical protein AAGI91_16015 [Bacteroidota bacterium]
METIPFDELEHLTQSIGQNAATLADYHRYEQLLLQSGLQHDYIFSHLNRAGFASWEGFIRARQDKERSSVVEGRVVGGLVGLGLGVLLYSALKGA